MKLTLFFLIGLFVSQEEFKLKTGDLIFQEQKSDEGVNKAIKSVTSSINSYSFTHVGIVYIDSLGNEFVLEATTPLVKKTSLNDYLNKNAKSVVGRIKSKHKHLIPLAISESLLLLGKEYDYGFIMNNDKYYCSEYIYHIFLKANQNQPLFELNKMTFKENSKNEFTHEWIEYFEQHGIPIPEGEWGINPGAMSKSDVLDIIHCYK